MADDVARAFAQWWPAWASDQGLREHDAHLADPSPDGSARVAAGLRGLLARLPPEGRDLDADVLRQVLEEELFHVEDLALHRRDPDLARELFDHVFGLLAKPAGRAPRDVLAAIAARLAAAPAFLEAGRRRIAPDEVPRLWADVALESVAEAPALLAAVEEAARAAALPGTDARAVAAGVAAARDALAAHEAWLRAEILPRARGTTAIGAEAFERLLRVRRLGADAATVLAAGERAIAEETERLREAAVAALAARGLAPGDDPVSAALAAIQERRPADFAAVLGAYATAIDEARGFVAARGLATLPDVPLRVVETPAYLRHLVPFAAYLDPGRWSPRPEGVYLVTPKEDASASPLADVRTTTVHEAWPGHHLQLSVARTLPLARFLAGAVEYIEGWALYCEDLMLRHGFLASADERLVQAKDSLWRALRIRLDVGLATGRVAYEDAVQQLVEAVAFSEAEARAEVKRYTLEPGYNLGYMWGKLAFLDLRRRWVDSGRLDERAFHDRVLAAGALPFPLLERALDERG